MCSSVSLTTVSSGFPQANRPYLTLIVALVMNGNQPGTSEQGLFSGFLVIFSNVEPTLTHLPAAGLPCPKADNVGLGFLV